MKKYTIICLAMLSVLLTTKVHAQSESKHWHTINSTSTTVSIPEKSVITYIGVNFVGRNPGVDKVSIGGVFYPTSIDVGSGRSYFMFTGEMYTDDKPLEIQLQTKQDEIKTMVTYYTVN